MEVLQSQERLTEDELGLALGELRSLSHVVEELSARAEVHNEMQVVQGLECEVDLDEEGRAQTTHYT